MSARALIAIALLMTSGLAAAAEIGRMFFTPAQRAALDAARKQNVRVEIGNEETERQPTAPSAAAPVAQTVRLNGMIQRSDGKDTVWLNNKPVTDRKSGGMNFSTNRNDARIKLQLPDGGRSMDLKVGQTAEIVSGTIEESYHRRAPLKIDEKPALPAAGNDAAGVQKRTSEAAPDSIESSSRLQRKPRTAPRDAQDETPAGGPDAR
jgi:hypothetical protein